VFVGSVVLLLPFFSFLFIVISGRETFFSTRGWCVALASCFLETLQFSTFICLYPVPCPFPFFSPIFCNVSSGLFGWRGTLLSPERSLRIIAWQEYANLVFPPSTDPSLPFLPTTANIYGARGLSGLTPTRRRCSLFTFPSGFPGPCGFGAFIFLEKWIAFLCFVEKLARCLLGRKTFSPPPFFSFPRLG